MNYRHIYHAGSFTDVFKHWILSLIIEKLCIKDTPFCLLDSHAGLGLYDLQHPHAQKTLEYKVGIEKLLDKQLDVDFQKYIAIVNKYMEEKGLYPGSAAIMHSFLRPADRLLLSELHPEDFAILQNNFKHDRRVKIFNQDAYIFLKANLPPKERRGLIFIDPPFEQTNELEQVYAALKESLKRFATGVYVIWYPIKDRKVIEKFYKQISALSLQSLLYVEICSNENIGMQLNSCGMLVINPPWKLAETINASMPKLLQYLQFDHGTFKVVQI